MQYLDPIWHKTARQKA